MDAEALSTVWNYLLVAYLAINLVGVAFTSVAKGSRDLIVFLLGISLIFESLCFHSFLFDASASLASAPGPFSMAILTYRLLLGYRFGLFQSVLTMPRSALAILDKRPPTGLQHPSWQPAAVSDVFIFELNFLIGWYL